MYADKYSAFTPPRWGLSVLGCLVFTVFFIITSAKDTGFVDINVNEIQIVGVPGPSEQCAGYCKQGTKFRLKPGSSYVYDYKALTISSVTGTSNDTSRLVLTAKAEVHVSSPCELILQLTNVKLEDSSTANNIVTSNRQEEFKSALETHPLRFSFQDGIIDQLCPSEDEAIWAVNIKRGILSSLQNSMTYINEPYMHTYEVDVSGICETIYRSQRGSFNIHLVEKDKNLLQCIGRGKQSLIFPGMLSASDETKSAPLIKSEQKCHQVVHVDGYVSKTTCIEVHQFTPFSNRHSGVNTRVVQTLELSNIVHNAAAPVIDKLVNFRTSLKFNYSSESNNESTLDELVALTLEKLLNNTENGVTKDVPQLFTLLVNQLKGFTYHQLKKVFTEKKDQRLHKFLLDAMPLVGTADSVLIMQDLFKSGDLTQGAIDTWLTSLLFYKKPTLQLLDAVKYFLVNVQDSKNVLTISSMVNSYCSLDDKCIDRQEIINIMNIIQDRLGESCNSETKNEKENMIVTLKAIGNAGIYTKPLDSLSSCYKNTLNPIEVRLAAVSAFRRFSCKDISKASIIDLFYDQKQDVELRIAGYLTAMQCPTTDIVEKVIDLLYSDETFHVKSFVWTHLTNLKETSSQWRNDIFHLLQEYNLPQNLTNEARFYSRNFENSVFNENLDIGATLDSNVIYSTHSYLPRSATLNLTLDLFGEAINVFEIGTRLEGFEDLIEDLFSKTGVFPEESLRGMLRSMRNTSSENEISSDIKKHADKFKSQKSFLEKPPRGSMFARIFGHELYLKQFYGLNELFKENKIIDNLFHFNTKNIFNSKDLDYTNSIVFLDSNYIIPTAVGFPLIININGTSTVGLKLKVEADLRELQRTKSGKIEFHLNPSATVQIIGSMTIDAKVTSSGIKSINTLNTNTYMDTKLKMEKGSVVDVYVNLPREQMEVFDVSSNLFLIQHDTLQEIKGIEENIEEWDACSGNRVTTISGLRLCSQLTLRNASQQLTAPYFPLTGSFKYAVLLQKTDTFDAYHLQILKDTILNKGRTEVSVIFDTPGSTMNRGLKANVKLGLNNAALLLDSPVGSLELNGKYKKSEVELQAVVNKRKVFNLLLALRDYGYGRYEPLFSVFVDGYMNVTAVGSANIVPYSKYSMDLKVTGLTRDPIKLSGGLNGKDGYYNIGLVVQAPLSDITLKGDIRFSKTSFSTKAVIDYSINNIPPQNFDFAIKLHAHKKGTLWKYGLVTALQGTNYPAYNSRFSWMLYQSENYFDCVTDLKFGKTEWNAQQMYHNYKLANGDADVAIKFTLSSPPKNLDYRLEYQFINTQTRTFIFGLAQLNEEQRFVANFDMHVKTPSDKRLSIELSNPWRGVYFNAHLEPKYEDILVMNVTTGLTENQEKYLELSYTSTIMFYGSEKQNVEITGMLSNMNVLSHTWYFHVVHQPSEGAFKMSMIINNYDNIDLNTSLMYNESYTEFNGTLKIDGRDYNSNFYFENTEQRLMLLTSLTLERKLSFSIESSQDPTYLSELKLFWDEERDTSQSLIMSFQNTDRMHQEAYIMMPGHYAAFDIRYLSEGLSSVNLTAIWGVSKDSATNAIKLSTAWFLSETDLTSTAILTTPFVGFEYQAINLKLVLSEDPYIKNQLKMGLQWQDQNLDLGLSWQILKSSIFGLLQINGTVEKLRNITLYINHQMNLTSLEELYITNVETSYNSIGNIKLQTVLLTKDDHKQLDLLLTSPFHNYKEILLNIAKKDREFKLVQSWAKDKTITLHYSYELPYRASFNFTSPFDGYNIALVDYSMDLSTPVSAVIIKGVLNKNHATFKIKHFQTLEVDEDNQMLNQIISAQIETEGNFLMPLLTANFTHKIFRENVSTSFYIINSTSKLLDLNFTRKYENMLLESVVLCVNMQDQKLNGKFVQNIENHKYNYKFEGFWNEDNIKIVLFSEFNTPKIIAIFNASSTIWNDDVNILFLYNQHNDNHYQGEKITLEVFLPSGQQNSPSVFKFDFSKFSSSIIFADLLLMSSSADTFKATYKYLMLNDTSHSQKIDIEYKNDKHIVFDLAVNNEEDVKFISLLVHSPLYDDIVLSADYKNKEEIKLILQSLLGNNEYKAVSTIYITNSTGAASLTIDTPGIENIVNTRLNFEIGQKVLSSDIFLSCFENTIDSYMFVHLNVSELSEQQTLLSMIGKIFLAPKNISFSLSHKENFLRLVLIDLIHTANETRSVHIMTTLNDDQSISVLKYSFSPELYLLHALHEHNNRTVFLVKTEFKFTAAFLSSFTVLDTPLENWEHLKYNFEFGEINNVKKFIGGFEKNKLKYGLKGKLSMFADTHILTADLQFNGPETNLTFYSKYNENNNYSLYIYVVYNEELVEGLTTLVLNDKDNKLKEGWLVESDFSKNGKHYKLKAGLQFAAVSKIYDIGENEYEKMDKIILYKPCDYHKTFYFHLQNDNTSHFINYNNSYCQDLSNKIFLSISLPYLSEFSLNLSSSTQGKISTTILSKARNFSIYGKFEDDTSHLTLISSLVNISAEFIENKLHASGNTEAYKFNFVTIMNYNKVLIDFNSNIDNWEHLNAVVEFAFETFTCYIFVSNGKDNTKLFLSLHPVFQCAASITISNSQWSFTLSKNHYIGNYECFIGYNSSGKQKRIGASFMFHENKTNINIVTPFEGFEDLRLTGKYEGVNAFVLEQNNKKIISASMSRSKCYTILTVSTFTEFFEYMNISLDMKGMLDKTNEDKTISLQIFRKSLKILDFSTSLFFNAFEKIGIESHLYTTAFSILNNTKFVAYLGSGKAVLYVETNQPLIDITGTMEGDIKNGILSLKTPLGFTLLQITSIQVDYDFLSLNKSILLQTESRDRLPYKVSSNYYHSELTTEVIIEFNTENSMDINRCRLYSIFNNSDIVHFSTVLDINTRNYVDISISNYMLYRTRFSINLLYPNLSLIPFINFDFRYNLLGSKKSIELNLTYNENVYASSGYFEWLDSLIDAKIYLCPNTVQFIFPAVGNGSHGTNVQVLYNFKDGNKYITLNYNTNNIADYKLNITSLNSKHLEFFVKIDQSSSSPILNYFDLKYDFMNDTVLNVKTKYNGHILVINYVLDTSNGTLSFTHQHENLLLDKFLITSNRLNRMSVVGILKNHRYFDMLVVKNVTEMEMNININEMWINLLEFHVENCLQTKQHLKWNITLASCYGDYSSLGEIQVPSVYMNHSKFVTKVMKNRKEQLFLFEAQTSCDKYSKRFCEQRNSYMNVHGLTQEPVFIYYEQKSTNFEKSLLLSYNVKDTENSILIQMPIKTIDLIHIEWKNTLLIQVHVQLKLLNSNYLSVTVAFQNKQYKLERRGSEITIIVGEQNLHIKYSFLQINNYSISLKSTFDILNNFNLKYNKNDNIDSIYVDFYILSNKYNIEWKGQCYDETNKNFNVSFTDIKNKFSVTGQKWVQNMPEKVNILSLLRIDNNGNVHTIGGYEYLRDGHKIKANLDMGVGNYSLAVKLESSNNRNFNNLIIQCRTPNTLYFSTTNLNFTETESILHQVAQMQLGSNNVQEGEIMWNLRHSVDFHEAQFKTKTGIKSYQMHYDFYKSTVYIKSPWFDLDESGLSIGFDSTQNSFVLNIFSGVQFVEFVHDLVFKEGSVYCSITLNTQTDFADRGMNYLVGYYDNVSNELKFEFDSPLISYEYVLFSVSQNGNNISKTCNLLLQKKFVDIIKFTVSTSTELNFNISGHFLEHTTVDLFLKTENQGFISNLKIFLFDEKFVNMTLNRNQQENHWTISLNVDKLIKISNLTVEVEHYLDTFLFDIKQEFIFANLKIIKNLEGSKSQLQITSNIIDGLFFNVVSSINVNKTSCQTYTTLIIVDSSEKSEVFDLGGMLSKENGIYFIHIYANNNNFTGKLYYNNTKTDILLEYLWPNANINASFNIYSKFSPILEVNISCNVLGKTHFLTLQADKEHYSFQTLAEIQIDNNSHRIEIKCKSLLIELSYLSNKVEMYKTFLKMNVNNIFLLKGAVKSPTTNMIDLEVKYLITEDITELQIRSSDRFELESTLFKNNFTLSLETQSTEYRITYTVEENQFAFNISSLPFFETKLLLTKGVPDKSYSAHFENLYNGEKFTAHGFIANEANLKTFGVDLRKNIHVISQIEATLKVENDLFNVTGLCYLAQSVNEIHFIHNLSFPIDTHLSISSPLLSNGIIEAGVTSKDASMLVLLRLGKTHVRLGASFDPEDGIKIEIQAPFFSQMDIATINGVLVKEVDLDTNALNRYKISASVAFTSDNVLLSQASVKFEMKRFSHIEMSVIMKTKTKQIDDVEMFVHMPLTFSLFYNANAQVSLTLSKVEPVFFYLHISTVQLNTTLKYFGQTVFQSRINSVDSVQKTYLNVFNHTLLLTTTKYELNKTFSFYYNNKQLFNFTYGKPNVSDWTKFTWILETCVKGHEKYGIKFEKKHLQHKKIMIYLSTPTIGSDVGFELEYVYNNITHNVVTAKFHLPFIVPGKEAYGFSFSNNINSSAKKLNVDYYIHIGKFLGSFSLFLQQVDNNNFHLIGKGQFKDKIIFLNANTALDPSKVQLYIDVGTPFDNLHDAMLHITLNTQLTGSVAKLSYNSGKIVDFKIIEKENKMKFLELNINRLSFSYAYLNKIGLSVNNLCFNVGRSPICIEFTSKSENKLNYYLSSKLIIESKVAAFEFGQSHAIGDLEYFAYLSWMNNRTFGFKLQREHSGDFVDEHLRYHSLEVVLPDCTIEGSSVILQRGTVGKAKLQLKWNLVNSSAKKIGMECSSELNGNTLIRSITFSHFALPHDFIISSQSNESQKKLIVQYSDIDEDLLLVDVYHWSLNVDNQVTAGMKFCVEHKATSTFIQLFANNTRTPVSFAGHLGIRYINSTLNIIKYIDAFGGIDFEKQKLTVDLASNGNNFVVSGSFWNKENSFQGITVETRLNQKEPVKFEVRVNTKPLELELELNHGLSHTYVTYLGMPSNKEITGKVFHTLNGYKNTDAYIALKLNTSRLLWGRFEFTKAMFTDLHNILLMEYSDADVIFSELLKGFVDFYQEELTCSLTLLEHSLLENVNVVLTQSRIKFHQVLNYFYHFDKILDNIFMEDCLYIQTIYRLWKRFEYFAMESANIGFDIAVNSMKHVFSVTQQMLLQIANHISAKLSNMSTLLPDFKFMGPNYITEFYLKVKSYKMYVSENFRLLISKTCDVFKSLHRELFISLTISEMEINNFVTQVVFLVEKHVYNTVVEWINVVDAAARTLLNVTSEMADIVLEGVMSIKELQQLITLCNDFKLWFDSILDTDLLFTIAQDFINDVVELVRADMKKNFMEYQSYVDKIVSSVTHLHQEILQQPTVRCILVRVNEIYQKVIWLWNYTGLSDENSTFWNAVLDIKSDDLTVGLSEVEHGMEELYSPKYVFDRSKNSAEFYQRLPFEWKGFNEIPNMTNIKAEIKQIIESEDEPPPNDSTVLKIVSDFLDEVSDDTSDEDLLSQSKGVSAMIAGNNIVTFDGSFYTFAGACSYTLAGDLITDSFSVILNYEMKNNKPKKKSLTVLTANNSVELGWDYSVSVDGRKLDLPAEIESNTVIHRRVNEMIMHSLLGYTIKCDFAADICTFTLSLYNFGKTGGLLGTYNNHNFDDLTSPDGKVLKLNEFVNSWVVGDSEEFDQCSMKLESEYKDQDQDHADFYNCETYFAFSESSLSKCFNSVDPRLFYQMCQSNLAYEKDPDQALFLTIEAYLYKCSQEGINLSFPKELSNCIDGYVKFSNLTRSADIVFVVEDANCTTDSNLGNIAKKLDTALKTNKINDTRFAVVSFGGHILSTPNIKTVNGQLIWTDKAKDVENMLTRKPTNIVPASEPPSAYEALNFASSLPYRVGVSKTIILVSCGNCADEDRYNELMKMLLKKDITLHILQNNVITGLNGKAKTVFGADSNGAYTRRNIKNLSPSLPLLKKVSLPKDLCTPTALDTNGTVFNLDLNKKVLDVWSSVVAKSLEPKNCQIFRCVQERDGSVMFVGESCSSSETSEEELILDLGSGKTMEYSSGSDSRNMEEADYYFKR